MRCALPVNCSDVAGSVTLIDSSLWVGFTLSVVGGGVCFLFRGHRHESSGYDLFFWCHARCLHGKVFRSIDGIVVVCCWLGVKHTTLLGNVPYDSAVCAARRCLLVVLRVRTSPSITALLVCLWLERTHNCDSLFELGRLSNSFFSAFFFD